MQSNEKSSGKIGHYALCLKEFKFAFVSTMAYIMLCCAICYFTGYEKSGETMPLIAGIPLWALLGVIIPWIAMVLLTIVYGMFVMKGDEE